MAGSSFEEVRVEGLVKVFGVTRALSGVDARFVAGRVTVIEGPNGSGKSTLLGILAQLVTPTRGEVFYGERRAAQIPAAELRASIGVLAHAAMVYPDLDALENLALTARLQRVEEPTARIEALRERFEIGRFAERPCRTYSRGQLQRVALARALLHEPALLLLDEPSTGLDRASVERLEAAVAAERERGAVVVLITHDVALADRLSDHRLRLKRGRRVELDA